MNRKIIFVLFLSFIFGQSNPIDIATTGARQLRMLGHMNVYHNPASLGYLTVSKKIDMFDNGEVEFIDSLDSEFSESFEQVEEADSNVVSEDAEFDDFEENESEEEIVFIEENILSNQSKHKKKRLFSLFSHLWKL